MSNLFLTKRWNSDINQVEVDEPVLGGDGGNANLATRQLGENALFLKDALAKEAARLDDHAIMIDEDGNLNNPHPQYVPFSFFNERISELMDMIKRLSTGQDSADVLLSRLKLSLNSNTNPKTIVADKQGFEFLGYSDINAMGVSYRSSRTPLSKQSYTFIFDLPAEYDPELHTVYSIASDGRLGILDKDTKKVKFTISTTESSRFVNSGDDEYTEYSSMLSESLTVEVYGKGEPVASSGSVLGRLDLSFSGAKNYYNAQQSIDNVRYSVFENGDFNFVLSDRFKDGSIGEVVCRYGDDSLVLSLYYTDGFDESLHEIGSNKAFTERSDGTGISFTLPYSSQKEEDSNFYKYSINTSFYFEIVKK